MDAVTDNVDLLTEILIRVQARPLVRFKCVSKRWLSLISHPEFCHRHTLKNPRPSSASAIFPESSNSSSFIISLHDVRPSSSASYSSTCMVPNPRMHDDNNDDLIVMQSCNGLLLLCSSVACALSYYVINPTTNMHTKLVSPSSSWPRVAMGLAFDPSSGSPHYKLLLFSVDPLEKQRYPRTMTSTKSHDFRIDEYSSETKTWRLVDSDKSARHDPTTLTCLNYFIIHEGGVYSNGALHWMGRLHGEIFYYHIDDERFGVVGPHHQPQDAHFLLYKSLHESRCGTRLNLVEYSNSSYIQVWEMRKDYAGWTHKYTARMDAKNFVVLCLVDQTHQGDDKDDGDDDDLSLLLHGAGQLVLYNLKSNMVKSFELTPMKGVDDSDLRFDFGSFRYMETLACV